MAFHLKREELRWLYTQTVVPSTLELMKRLHVEPLLVTFSLAGGTALALYMGHCRSVNLGLFTPCSFDAVQLETYLAEHYGFRTDFLERDTLKSSIEDVKIACIACRYEYLKEPCTDSGIRLYSQEDIIAMKLSVIADDELRPKVFIDITCLAMRFTFYEILKCYECKFPRANVVRLFKAITYFDDIDFDEDVVMLNFEYDWSQIA